MAANDRVRIEIGFQGGEVLAARVPASQADALEERLRGREDAVCELEADDGRFLVVLSRVLYVKRYAREARVGFTPS
ncbi:MAG: hypothetical protein C4306_01250 [Thermoleophilia bacterium]